MSQNGHDKGHQTQTHNALSNSKSVPSKDFVLEKTIFSNIFEKDIRRIYIYKKAERLAKAIHLIAPAFRQAPSMKDRFDAIAIALVDASVAPIHKSKLALSRELLTLSSMLGVARTSGLLSPMNADLISSEAHILLQEVASYEEPRLLLDEVPTLAEIAKEVHKQTSAYQFASDMEVQKQSPREDRVAQKTPSAEPNTLKRQKPIVKDKSPKIKDREDTILTIVRTKGSASIKDISTMMRGISEKTIQRELTTLITAGKVQKRGERRWSTYSLSK